MRDVFFQVQEVYDKELLQSKTDRVRSLLDAGNDVRISIRMQGSQTTHHEDAMILVSIIQRRIAYPTPPSFALDIPNGNISTVLWADRRT